MIVGEAREFHDSRGEQGFGAFGIFALVVVERGGDLDQALEEGFFRFEFEEPDFFPEFVGFEEFLRVEMRAAYFEFLFSLCRIHRAHV